MAANPKDLNELTSVEFSLNGHTITAFEDETILQAARRNGVDIPHLCFKDGLRADGNCRACVVEIEGERVLQPSCVRTPTEGMVVNTTNERVEHSQKMVLELLQSDMADKSYTLNSELDHWSQQLAVGLPRFEPRHNPEQDLSHPAIAVNLDACIQCTRCVRACREEQNNDVIGYSQRGAHSEIVFDIADPMGDSSCVGCGECVQACPTGALMPSKQLGLQEPDKKVESACPYCGVGCLLTFNVKDEKIIYVEGRDGPANKSRLCVKGRYGFDYIHNDRRLTTPLIRKEGAAKVADIESLSEADIANMFREASWEEALEFAATGLRDIRDDKGGNALAGFGSAKGSNEEAYLFQKLIRTGFNTNNVDHCTRLCHASSVVALLEGIGSGAVSNQVAEVKDAEVIVIIGSNPTVNHPVAATFIKNAARDGKTLIVMDPRRTEIARHADHVLQFKPDTDVAMLNAIMHSIIKQGLVDKDFIANRTEGYAELEKHLQDYAPEQMEKICGIPAATLHEVARVYASSKASIIFWGMGVSQHIHGTDNARCLIALSLMTGQIGKPGSGLHPLRGQNNVQGASDVGLIPMVFPDYQRVDNPQAQARFEKLWNANLDPNPGLTVVEIMEAITQGDIQGLYVEGENPAMSDPNLNHARHALASLKHLVVQDIFMTETALFADVILPASAFPEKDGTFTNTDRRVQLGRQAVQPPGQAKQDLWIIQEIAKRMGLDWNYAGPQEVFAEMCQGMDSIKGMSWERLERDHSVTYPCDTPEDPGQGIIFVDDFPTASGRAKIVPAPFTNADELPDDEYSYVLITGRQLEHWHTGSMTRRASMLDAIEPVPTASINPLDLEKLGVKASEMIRLRSRRGAIECYARADDGLLEGQIFMPFCYHEAAANLLTTDALDPFAKIPEFKFCAIQVEVPESA
ncbi:MAG: formate dehydrogenase subunit alpha [Gammaproteobacteria bacterium TMED119]|nr:MAG: formate dehydrogenase subunit alpha [Gammaproteobacteria bacterium TMED119]RCL45253.1 MAG: formate dehydrogenase subunit alpha [Candidatus Thioglobus sp.]